MPLDCILALLHIQAIESPVHGGIIRKQPANVTRTLEQSISAKDTQKILQTPEEPCNSIWFPTEMWW